jgi:hypothetical protein
VQPDPLGLQLHLPDQDAAVTRRAKMSCAWLGRPRSPFSRMTSDPSPGGLADFQRSVRWQVCPLQLSSMLSRHLDLLHQAARSLRQPEGGTTQRWGCNGHEADRAAPARSGNPGSQKGAEWHAVVVTPEAISHWRQGEDRCS